MIDNERLRWLATDPTLKPRMAPYDRGRSRFGKRSARAIDLSSQINPERDESPLLFPRVSNDAPSMG